MVIVSHVKSNGAQTQQCPSGDEQTQQLLPSDEQTQQHLPSDEQTQQCLRSDSSDSDQTQQRLRSDSSDINILLTLLNITINTFIKVQDSQFFVEFIVYNNSNDFVRYDNNPICCMAIELDMLINLVAALEFINMPCIQNKLNSDVESLILIKFMQFCSNFANMLNIEKNNINMIMSSNHYFDTTFAEVFNSIDADY
jgi:hypothetical protein